MSALGYDPAPGDVATVYWTAATMTSVAVAAENLHQRLRTLDDAVGPQVWEGDAATAFGTLLAEVAPAAVRLACAHREAEDQLTAYAVALGQAQEQARRAEQAAGSAIAERDRQRSAADAAAADAATHAATARACRAGLATSHVRRIASPPDPAYLAQLDAYDRSTRARLAVADTAVAGGRRREQAARVAADAAGQRLQAARWSAEDAREQRDAAARGLVTRLDAAGAQPRGIDLLGAIGTGLGLVQKLITAGDITDFLAQQRHRVGRYKKAWEELIRRAERDGGRSALLRYKSWPITQRLGRLAASKSGPFPLLRQLATSRFAKVVDLGQYLLTLQKDVAQLRRHWANGDGWGVVGSGLGTAGRTAQYSRHPYVYAGGYIARQYGGVIEEARKVDWHDLPSWDDWQRYGWDSFKEAGVETAKKHWGYLWP